MSLAGSTRLRQYRRSPRRRRGALPVPLSQGLPRSRGSALRWRPCVQPSSTSPARIEAGDRPDPVIRRADRRDRPRRARLRLRLGPLVLPRRLAVRARPDRPRVHRRRRGRRRRRRERRARATSSSRRSRSATAPARNCRHGITTACVERRLLPDRTATAARARRCASRSPTARSSPVPGSGHSDEMLRSLLTLSDVMATGHHAAVCAEVRPGQTVAVVGDGAVGLSGVLAAKRLGAERIIALSPPRRPPGARHASSAPPTSSPSAARRPSRRSRR